MSETFAGFDELSLDALAIGVGPIDRRILQIDDRLSASRMRWCARRGRSQDT